MRICGCFVALALLALLVTGCGQGSGAETEPASKKAAATTPEGPADIKVSTESWENPSDLGVIAALTRGFFADAGRNVWVGVPARPRRPVPYVINGKDTFAVAQLPQVVMAVENGAPVVAVRSLVSRPTTAMIWLKRSHIRSIADLKGKTIAFPGVPYQKRFLKAVLAQAGLGLKDVHLRRVNYELVPALLSGQVDATFGGTWNVAGVQLEALGAEPVIKRVQSLGAPLYEELVLIARKDLVSERPKLVRDVVAAIGRGAALGTEDYEAARDAMEEADEPDLHYGPAVTQPEFEKTVPMLSKTGRINPGKARNLIRWMHEEGMLQQQIPVSELITNAYLPAHP